MLHHPTTPTFHLAVYPGGTESAAGARDSERLAWLLRLACHRDSSVRSLALAIVAEVTPSLFLGEAGPVATVAAKMEFTADRGWHGDSCGYADPGIGEGQDSGHGEVVRACVRAALDGYHESPAVTTEALRFLGR